MIKKLSLVAVVLFGAFGFAACDAEPEDESAGDEEADVDADGQALDAVFIVSRVELTEDGPGHVEQWETTRRIQLAEARLDSGETLQDGDLAAAQEAVSYRYTGCQPTDFKMWNDPNYTGDQVCFYGASGHTDMHNYVFGGPLIFGYWDGQVESFKTGSTYDGAFAETNGGFSVCLPCWEYTASTNVANYTHTSEFFFLDGYCVPC